MGTVVFGTGPHGLEFWIICTTNGCCIHVFLVQLKAEVVSQDQEDKETTATELYQFPG